MTALAEPGMRGLGPGIHRGIPDDVYHADPVPGGSLSHSGARILANRTPAHFDYYRRLPQARTSSAFDLGHAVHAGVLGAGAPVQVVDAKTWQGKAAKEAAEAARAAGMTPLLAHEKATADAMVTAIRQHPQAGPLLEVDGDSEVTIIYEDPETGVMCRTRIDRLTHNPETGQYVMIDVKTSKEDAAPATFARSLASYQYHQQDAFYRDGPLALGAEIVPEFWFVIVEKDPPHLVSVVEINPTDVAYGRALNRKARHRYAECTASGEWPGHPMPPRPAVVSLPGWLRAAYDHDETLGMFLA